MLCSFTLLHFAKIFLKKMEEKKEKNEFYVIQKLYDYIMWITPLINRLPRDKKFGIGDRLLNKLYDIMELLLIARYEKNNRQKVLKEANIKLEMSRMYQRLIIDEKLWNLSRFEFASKSINEVGALIGSWIKNINQDK